MHYLSTILIYLSIYMNLKICAGSGPKIAIIGAGIGGTSTALFLSDIEKLDAEIHIYEQHSEIGGRIISINDVDDEDSIYELGASYFSCQDQYVNELLARFNLKKNPKPMGKFPVIYNMKPNLTPPIDEESKIGKTAGAFISHMDNGVKNIYKKKLQSFNTVTKILKNIGAPSTKNLENELKLFNVSPNGILECKNFVTSAYGGFEKIPILAGYIIIKSFLLPAQYFSIQGGNIQLVEICLIKSGAKLYKNVKVIKLTKIDDDKIELTSTKDDGKIIEKNNYDFVIISTPNPEIKFENYENLKPIFGGKFQPKTINIVKGDLNEHFFRPNLEMPNYETHIHMDDRKNNLIDISKLKKNVWKVQSDWQLTKREMDFMFNRPQIIKEFNSVGYPDYKNYQIESDKDAFELDTHLYYINCIEWAASSVEMILIGAKNVAKKICDIEMSSIRAANKISAQPQIPKLQKVSKKSRKQNKKISRKLH